MITTIRGKKYKITKEQIETNIKGIEPDEGKKYFIKIKGEEYPIKQVIREVLNLPVAGFNTQDAYTILSRLNYKIITRG